MINKTNNEMNKYLYPHTLNKCHSKRGSELKIPIKKLESDGHIFSLIDIEGDNKFNIADIINIKIRKISILYFILIFDWTLNKKNSLKRLFGFFK